ncbi:MAG TPA: DUF3455 domain-containing protein [Polyangiaceae bacterium]|nr:DUF3455 domain-containing protein [Polyangiaceae bacterium]
MSKPLFGSAFTPWVAALSALGLFVACNDSSDGGGSGEQAGAGASQGGTKAGAGAPASAGAPSNGGAQARAGSSATGAAPTTGGAYGSGGAYGTAGARDYPPATDAGAPAAGGASADGGASDSAGAAGAAPCVPEPPTLPTDVPAMIVAPDGVTLLRHFHAVGTQNYRCRAHAGPTFTWDFTGPAADMLNSCGKKVGTHFAAPNTDPPAPAWQYDIDGSSVVGAKVNASPVDGAIPELLLKAVDHGGNGVFTGVTFVQRLHTAGGAAPPAASCDALHVDEDQDVGYTAEYYFYSGGN